MRCLIPHAYSGNLAFVGCEPTCGTGGVWDPIECPNRHNARWEAFEEEEQSPICDGNKISEAYNEIGQTAGKTGRERRSGDEDSCSESQLLAPEEE